jgi:GTPase SAR1 family protein
MQDVQSHCKVVVVGGRGVGKTAIVRRYTGFESDVMASPTEGFDIVHRQFTATEVAAIRRGESIKRSKTSSRRQQDAVTPTTSPPSSSTMVADEVAPPPLRLDLWDVSHQLMYADKAERDFILRNADGIIIVADPSDEASLRAVDDWRVVLLSSWPAAAAASDVTAVPISLFLYKPSPDLVSFVRADTLSTYVRASGLCSWCYVSPHSRTSIGAGLQHLIKHILEARDAAAAADDGDNNVDIDTLHESGGDDNGVDSNTGGGNDVKTKTPSIV